MLQQVEHNLLIPNSLDIAFLCKQATALMHKGVSYCDLYLQNSASESFSLDEGIIKSGSFALNSGIGVRAICHDKTFLSYANSLSPTTISGLIANIFIEPVQAHIAPKQQVPHSNITSSTNNTNTNSNKLYTTINPIEHTNSADKIALLMHINNLGRKEAYVSNVIASLSLEYDEICIINGLLNVSCDIRPLVHLSISIIINMTRFVYDTID